MTIFEHEQIMWKLERKARDLWITTLVMLGLLIVSNVFWIVHFIG